MKLKKKNIWTQAGILISAFLVADFILVLIWIAMKLMAAIGRM